MADFWDQFPLYESGGITGQPSVDPSQFGLAPGSAMTQGGGTDDPRWTNGTWGGSDSLPTKPGAPIYQPGPSSADLAAQHPDWPKTPWGMPYDPAVGYNTGINGGLSGNGGLTTQPMNGGATPTAGPAPTGGGDPNAFRDAWFASPYPKTTDGLKQFVAANPQFGAQITGSKGSKVIVGGQAFQAVRSAGINGGIGPAWDPLGAEGGGGGGGNTLAGLGYGFGSSMAPWTEGFQAPDPNQIANDPYYQFQMKEGMKGIQNSAAAKGTLLTGGTLKGLEQYGQGLASSFGDKAYDRGMNEYLLRRENFYNNEDRPFSKNVTLANLGRPT